MSAHIRSAQPFVALQKMTELLRLDYNIYHTSIQVEPPASAFSLEAAPCENDKVKVPEE
jgi:hypothetical protein